MAESSGGRGFRGGNVLLVLAIIGLLVGVGALYYNQTLRQRDQGWAGTVRQLQQHALETSRIGDDVGRGLPPDFATVAHQMARLENSIGVLRQGDPAAEIPPMPASVNRQVSAAEDAWASLRTSIDRVLKYESAISNARSALTQTDHSAQALITVYTDTIQVLADSGDAKALARAGQQLARAQQLRSLSYRVLRHGHGASALAGQLTKVADRFVSQHARLNSHAVAGRVLRAPNAQVDRLASASAQLKGVGAELNEMQIAAAALPDDGKTLAAAAVVLEQRLAGTGGPQRTLELVALPALGIAVLSLLAYVVLIVITARRRIRVAEERDARQQAAILSLLDEIATLADGDLTVTASVTEDFTGAIGDSINYTVATLRSLVGTINRTSSDIAAAAGATRAIAESMRQASETQAGETVKIATRITASAESLNEVAGSAEALSHQAGESVDIARQGVTTVGRTIAGMTALREQIQDTAKRIKRLGESSQEIGNIIEFINDIAEQTNTLALNASIQAAMAGESGRGFAVVADEVQRLAERAGTATRQIETLVKTIQADTNEAIVSMERSTANVVAGASSAEEAGQALTRIESSSTELSEVIQQISAKTRNEAGQATKIAGRMQGIREIGLQTAKSADRTAQAVSELNDLSEKLRESVAGFKLPDDEQSSSDPA